jgi:hypothetical protein
LASTVLTTTSTTGTMQNSLIAVQSAVEPKDAAVVVRTSTPLPKNLYSIVTYLLIILVF